MNTILQQIHTFDDLEQSYMIHNLRTLDIPYVKNTNGFFFNLTNYNRTIIQKINEYINIILNNRKIILESNQERQQILNEYKQIAQVKKDKHLFLQQNNTNINHNPDYTNITLDIQPITKSEVYVDIDKLILDYNKKQSILFKNTFKFLQFKYKNNETSSNTENDVSISYLNHSDEHSIYESTVCELDMDYTDVENDNNDNDNDSIMSYESEQDIKCYIMAKEEINKRLTICRNALVEKGFQFDVGAYDILEYEPYI